MLSLVILGASMLVVVSAQTPKPHCCTPDQWEGGVSEAGGFVAGEHMGYMGEGGKLSYDRTNKRLAHESRYIDDQGNGGEYKYIHDFKSDMRYIIKDGNCNATKGGVHSFNKFCIPGDARPIAQNFHLGSGRHNRLACRSYFRESVGLSFVTTITEHGCIPVIDTLIGMHAGIAMTSTHLFSDVTPGIQDEAVFTPPSNCKMVPHIRLPPADQLLFDRLTQTV